MDGLIEGKIIVWKGFLYIFNSGTLKSDNNFFCLGHNGNMYKHHPISTMHVHLNVERKFVVNLGNFRENYFKINCSSLRTFAFLFRSGIL